MDIISEGCRLCLDPFTQCFTTIDSPQMKDQMDKVFCFSIEPKPGYCSGVCQSCSYAISEFYQYSEKVRQNQELLNANVTNCDPTIDSKVILERVKIEKLNNYDLSERTEGAWELEKEVCGEEEATNSEMYEQMLEADIPGSHDQEVLNGNERIGNLAVDSKITLESVKVETLSDLELPETTEDTGEPIIEASAEEEVSNLDSEITLENVKVEASDEEEAPHSGDSKPYEPPPKKSQTTSKRRPKRNEEDQVFNKHFRMICDLCGMSAETFTELSNHLRKEHKRRDGYVVCCNKKLVGRFALRDHIVFHANPDTFRCEVCGNKYMRRESLIIHMISKHPSTGPFKCDLCPHSFAQEMALTRHMKRHLQMKCPHCDKTFARKQTLSCHIVKFHSGVDRTMVCDTCGKEFRDQYAFKRHINKHKGIWIQKKFQCGICQRWLKSKSSLQYHMTCVHTDGNQEQQCDICLQKFPHPQAVKNHKLYMHSEPRHECDICGKKFKWAIALKEHRATHTGQVLYSCEYCGIPQKLRANLYHHIRRHHPTEWAQKKLLAYQKDGPS